MFCTTCGKENPDDSTSCQYCYAPLTSVELAHSFRHRPNLSKRESNVSHKLRQQSFYNEIREPKINVIRLILFILAGIAIMTMCFVGAEKISSGGLKMMDIRSVGGKTLEEAYYKQIGAVYQGIALFVQAIGVFGAAVMVHFGLKKE